MAFRFVVASRAFMRAVSMGPAIAWGSARSASGFSFGSSAASSGSSSASASAAASASSSSASLVVAVVDLGLEIGDGCLEGLHLVVHCLAVLGGVGHVGKLEVHLLFGQ